MLQDVMARSEVELEDSVIGAHPPADSSVDLAILSVVHSAFFSSLICNSNN